jgi:hypothetical protein
MSNVNTNLEAITTTPNKIWAFVFGKMVCIVATDLLMFTDRNRNLLKIRSFVGKKQVEVSNTLHQLI